MDYALVLAPDGHLVPRPAAPSDPGVQTRPFPGLDADAVPAGAALLLHLAGPALSEALSPAWGYWRDFAAAYVAALCHAPEVEGDAPAPIPPPPDADLARRALARPPMTGAEYLTPALLRKIWAVLDEQARALAVCHAGGLSAWARSMNPLWRRVGRVCFHLAENRSDSERPFAFLATYAPGLSDGGRVRYVPLSRALREYAGEKNRAALARLLTPVKTAAEKSALARELVESGEVFHPLAWKPAAAHRFLLDIPLFEESGLAVRMPDWWRKRPRPVVKAVIGASSSKNAVGKDAALSFDIRLALGDETLSDAEWAALRAAGDGLTLLRGQWVEVDAAKLDAALAHWRRVEAYVGREGFDFLKAMRLLAGAPAGGVFAETVEDGVADWSRVVAGGALADTLARLRDPDALPRHPGTSLRATLRPYQEAGVSWLRFVSGLGLGACLADDMGLGKTVQVLALLLLLKQDAATEGGADAAPALLILPASLLGNWKAEAERFAPTLRTRFLHPAFQGPGAARDLTGVDAVFTSYGMAVRQPWLAEVRWRALVLDEAQAIKNPGARQTKFVKTIPADVRIALTGTPVENRLGDLWSLFDFINPGLLGGAKAFAAWVGRLEKRKHDQYAPLRALTGPYLLRRLKTDSAIRGDLPDKTEMDVWCGLAKPQAVLYARAVAELKAALELSLEGVQRQGVVLSFLMRFKQLCNHPDQGVDGGAFAPDRSGKFKRLGALAEEIAARQERLLVFTQFREMTTPLAEFLGGVFGRAGLVLHGQTPVGERKKRVDAFQRDDGPPFFVLSLKAGGTGLNLTAATQVVHFDRWWNPAVENQATDRAYRIGQRKNVLVHKFICRGTVEERIHARLREKQSLADEILVADGLVRALTDMTDKELLSFVALDAAGAAADD